MEVKIGIQQAAREIVFESESNAAKVTKAIEAARANDELVLLENDKGGTIAVAASKIAYVEFGSPRKGAVGFAG